MGLLILTAGLILFLGAHVFVTLRGRRAATIARLGESPYKGLFSLPAVGLDQRLVSTHRATTRYGSADVAGRDPGAGRLSAGAYQRAVKPPMLAGVKLWAFAHLLANGDLGSIVLFGSFLAWGVYARIAAKRRGETAGTNPTVSAGAGWTNDVIAIVGGTVLYLILGLWFHPAVIGVPVFGR